MNYWSKWGRRIELLRIFNYVFQMDQPVPRLAVVLGREIVRVFHGVHSCFIRWVSWIFQGTRFSFIFLLRRKASNICICLKMGLWTSQEGRVPTRVKGRKRILRKFETWGPWPYGSYPSLFIVKANQKGLSFAPLDPHLDVRGDFFDKRKKLAEE